MNKRIVSFFFLLLFTGAIYAAIDITDLRTELLKSPEGIDVRQPRLSWRIESDEQNVIQTCRIFPGAIGTRKRRYMGFRKD
jgi:alpha-L-rhamnosidase